MTTDLTTLDVRDGDAWRAWLQAHHAASPGVWLVFHKRHTGVTCISYEASVRQALCFGWIDSLVRRLDDGRRPVGSAYARPPVALQYNASGQVRFRNVKIKALD